MVHLCHSCQVKQPLEAYPGVEGHDGQQGFLKKAKRLIMKIRGPFLDSPRDNAPQSFAYIYIILINLMTIKNKTHLQLCHKCFQCLQKFSCSLMSYFLLVQALLNSRKKQIELLWANHWPWDDVKFATVEFCNEICILFILHNFLEFQWEPFNLVRSFQYKL